MKTARKAAGVIALILVCSCAALPHRKTEIFLFSEDRLSDTWTIVSLSAEGGSSYPPVTNRLPEMLQSLGRKHGVTIHRREDSGIADPDALELTLWVREKDFTRSLENLNSITMIITLRDRSGDLLRAVYTEESRETVESAYHLYSITEKLVRALAREIERSERRAK